jgi:Holliday junction resolvase RusA-like endonuclease
MRIEFTIPIIPKPQKRDRIASFGGHGRSYKDKKQSEYESKVSALIAQYRPEKPIDGDIVLEVRCYLQIPKSKTKRFKQDALNGFIRPTGKPDVSNLAKNVEDIMNGIFYRDDAQIVDLTVEKWYSDNPRWEIALTTMDYFK